MFQEMDELYGKILPAGLFVIFFTIIKRVFFMEETQLETKIHFQESSTLAQKIVTRCKTLNERYAFLLTFFTFFNAIYIQNLS